jgi:hypothetical protein
MRALACLLVFVFAASAFADDYLLCSPHTEVGDLYKGQLHCHSSRSDGKQSAEVVLRAYGGAGYDFVALSDHLVVGKDPGVGGITWIPSSEVHTEAAEKDKGWGGHHIGAFGITRDPKSWDRGSTDAVLRQIGAVNGVSAAFHPRLRNRWSIERLTKAKDLSLVSIFNGRGYAKANGLLPGSGSGLYDSNPQWDGVLSRGRYLWGIATDDCHDVTDAGAFNQGWVRVRAASRTPKDLLSALRRGDFYACRGPKGEAPTLSVVTRRTSAGWEVTATSKEGVGVLWLAKSGLVASGKGGSSYTPKGDEGYLRAVAIDSRDSDARTYGQPIFVARGPKVVLTAREQTGWTLSFQDGDGRPVPLRRPLTLDLSGDGSVRGPDAQASKRLVVQAGRSSVDFEAESCAGQTLTPEVARGWPVARFPE